MTVALLCPTLRGTQTRSVWLVILHPAAVDVLYENCPKKRKTKTRQITTVASAPPAGSKNGHVLDKKYTSEAISFPKYTRRGVKATLGLDVSVKQRELCCPRLLLTQSKHTETDMTANIGRK
jgi:hypothetical protein